MVCPRCGRDQRGNPSYCRWCGQSLGLIQKSGMSVVQRGHGTARKVVFGFVAALAILLVIGVIAFSIPAANDSQHAQASEVEVRGVGELHGVVIGVSDYLYLPDLPGIDNAATETWEQFGMIWGEQAHLRLLVDDQATRANIERAMTSLAQEEDADDTVLFYFIGHGDEKYIAPHDSSSDSYSRDIPSELLDRWLDTLDSSRVIIVIDSCQSGGYIERLSEDGRVILAACTANETAVDLMSDYLIPSFSDPGEMDYNGDGLISAEELFAYVKSQRIPDQHPCMFDGFPGELVLVTVGA